MKTKKTNQTKTERKGTLPNSFYQTRITLILKPDKDNHTYTQYYRPIFWRI
jgi:hypothetical protein